MSTTPTFTPSIPPPPGAPVPTRTPDPRRRGVRRYALGASLAVSGLVLALLAWGGLTGPSGEENATIRPTGPVDRIELDVEAGEVEIVSGDEVRVEVTGEPGRGGSVTDSDLTDGLLRVTVSCSRISLLRGCGTPVTVVVPPGTPVSATTDAGTITASGLTAGADLRTTAGRIDVRDLQGTIRLRSDAGSIRGTVVNGTVEAGTDAGSITLTVIEDISRLSARAGAGSIELVVPDAPYRIEADTTLGHTDIEVASIADATRMIDARSEVGNVTIRTGAND